jgi:hypothetical protein
MFSTPADSGKWASFHDDGRQAVNFEGAKMPLLERATGSSCPLLGPCFAEGISNGEPAATTRRGDLLVELILFCSIQSLKLATHKGYSQWQFVLKDTLSG